MTGGKWYPQDHGGGDPADEDVPWRPALERSRERLDRRGGSVRADAVKWPVQIGPAHPLRAETGRVALFRGEGFRYQACWEADARHDRQGATASTAARSTIHSPRKGLI
ncbi:hypothetical protein GCM10022239_10470 [Leifsonia bigeumensis]|uniref:Uncharacterized protein n=1 Tax=Leifsonella bigeumensis TaxID=433643 RepID=A0ABP7FI15_9MICO